MKRLLTIMLMFCFVLSAFALYSQDPGKKPKMVVAESTYNAGDVYRTKDKIEHTFVIKNTGTAELKILSARPG